MSPFDDDIIASILPVTLEERIIDALKDLEANATMVLRLGDAAGQYKAMLRASLHRARKVIAEAATTEVKPLA